MPSDRNIVFHHGKVTRADRERRLGQRGGVWWFTGLSGSGKSTLCRALEDRLARLGHIVTVLDGDNIRHGLCKDLGFSERDRQENIRRVAEVAALLADAGLLVLTAFISPFRADRDAARAVIGAADFVEVFVDTPLEVCEGRDPKGLYKKARAGAIAEFTGITSPYEPPAHPELRLETAKLSIEQCVDELVEALRNRGRLAPPAEPSS
ncbi:MAG: adenylyl-sulfate kinase [Planctomycetota bacterium]